MGVFDELKEWFSLEDAAAYVSANANVQVKEKDLLELAAEQKLTLHYNFVAQIAAALPNHDKWEMVYNEFSPTYPKQNDVPKNDILYGKYRVLPTADFLSGLSNYSYDMASHECPNLTFVLSEKSGQIYMPCSESGHSVHTTAKMSVLFSCKQAVVAKNDLESLLEEIAEPSDAALPNSEAQSGYVSPYIEFMLQAICANGITKEYQSKHSVLKQWFLDNPPNGVNISDSMAKSMATLIRLPEAGIGGNKKTKNV